MRRASLLHGVAVLLLSAGTAMAQDTGGIGFAPGGISAANLAQAFAQPPRQPVFVGGARRGAPPGARVTNPAQSRKEVHQQMIAKVRGDAGFLAGFQKGQPLAASRNPPPEFQPSLTFIDAPFIVNNINSALNVAFGEGNTTEQGVATDSGGERFAVDGGTGDSGIGNSGVGETAVESPAPSPVQTSPVQTPAPAPSPTVDPATSRHKRNQPKTPDFLKMPDFPKMPEIPAMPKLPADQPDTLMTTLGPLPYLPFAMKNGGVQFNNANSAINIAAGVGNVAGQRVKTIQR